MSLTGREHGGKAFKIFEATKDKFTKHSTLWSNCVSLSIDNTNTVIGINDSVASHFVNKNPEIQKSLLQDVHTILLKVAASHANDSFSKILGINVEDVCIDCFYWFNIMRVPNTKANSLIMYFNFCNQEYQAVVKHPSV